MCQALNVKAAVSGVVHGHLDRRVTNGDVSTDCVSLESRNQIDPIRVADGRVLLDHVAGAGSRDKTDPKVVLLG